MAGHGFFFLGCPALRQKDRFGPEAHLQGDVHLSRAFLLHSEARCRLGFLLDVADGERALFREELDGELTFFLRGDVGDDDDLFRFRGDALLPRAFLRGLAEDDPSLRFCILGELYVCVAIKNTG